MIVVIKNKECHEAWQNYFKTFPGLSTPTNLCDAWFKQLKNEYPPYKDESK